MDELVPAERDPDVRGTRSNRREEDQIARPDILQLYGFSQSELFADVSRQLNPMLGEHELGEPAAVESTGVRAAIPIRRAL